MPATVVSFGEWLPDQPDMTNGGLIEANNVLPEVGGYYRHYNPLAAYSAGSYTLPATARGLTLATDPIATRLDIFYAGSDDHLFLATAGGQFQTRSGVLSANSVFDWQFQQFGNLMFACNGRQTMVHTVKALTDFVTATAPQALAVGKIGEFLMVGNIVDTTTRPFTVSWSAIADPNNFPPANSATAIAKQSGEQDLNENFGPVRAIVGGDQYGLVFQDNGITRVTYVGPPVVFQFDVIEKTKGAVNAAIVKAGSLTYFLDGNGAGFHVTDGVSCKPVGSGKVDKTFLTSGLGGTGAFNIQPNGVYDQRKKCSMWTYSEGASVIASRLMAMHVETGWWSRANEAVRCVDKSELGSVLGPYGFNLTNVLCSWQALTTRPANIGTALLTTQELEINPGARAYVDGIKPNVQSSGTAPAVTVRIGSRNDIGTTSSFTATTTPTTRTGFADFRVDARYHRAEVQIVGAFEKAIGIEVKAQPTGET